MKRIVLLLVVLFCSTVRAQIQKLGELSAGQLLDSAVIMEEDESDVFGYCLLYELDRKSREVFELEYVILDKNLNKLTAINLTQAVYKNWMIKTKAELTFVKKIGNQLTIGVNDRLVKYGPDDILPFFNYRFINLNLDDFHFSKEFRYENFTKNEFAYKEGDQVEIKDFWDVQKVMKTKSNVLLAFATPEYNPKVAAGTTIEKIKFKKTRSVPSFAILDKELKPIWSQTINGDKKTACEYNYLDSDNEILLFSKSVITKNVLEVRSIEAYDISTGALLGEIIIEGDKDENDFDFNTVKITKDKIHLFTSVYSKKGKSLGYGHRVFGKRSLSEDEKRDMITWEALGAYIPNMSKNGEIDKVGWLIAQDFIITPSGNLLLVLEAFETKSTTSKTHALLKDMYLFEFKPDGGVAFTKKIEKKNSVQMGGWMSVADMKNYGIFDYIFCQKINKAGDFVMYYTLNDQAGNHKAMAKKPLWTLGIISNVGGEYGFETLPLYGENKKIYPGLAKNGYIRLTELNEKTGEADMRLEKINY